jgi:hypothetical protein
VSEFAGAGELALGSVYGIRSWRPGGWNATVGLEGLYGQTWKRGENAAVCGARVLGEDVERHRAPDEGCQCGFYAYWHLSCIWCYAQARAAVYPPPPVDRERELAELIDAGRYFPGMTTPGYDPGPAPDADPVARRVLERGDLRNEHTMTPCTSGTWIHGVIEGYGLTLIGAKGFRCEKARIRALCLPARPDSMEGVRQHLERAALLGRRYRVPVYSSVITMLDEHPPTRDYRDTD